MIQCPFPQEAYILDSNFKSYKTSIDLLAEILYFGYKNETSIHK